MLAKLIACFAVIMCIFLPNLAWAQSRECADLRSQLASIPSDGPQGGLAAQQLSEIQKARGDLGRLRCELAATQQNPSRAQACENIGAALDSMESNYARLSRGGGGGNAALRARIIAQIKNQGCDREQTAPAEAIRNTRQAPAPVDTQQYRAPDTNTEGGFLSWLFGRMKNPQAGQNGQFREHNLGEPIDPNQPVELMPDGKPAIGGGLRTLCVRTCDGYYWPISFSTSSRAFERDENACGQMCPTQDTQLFYHYNQGQWSDDMVSLEGTPYKSMPYAFAYRSKYNPECSCRPLPKKAPQSDGKIAPISAAPNTSNSAVKVGIVADENKPALTPVPNAVAPKGRASAKFYPVTTPVSQDPLAPLPKTDGALQPVQQVQENVLRTPLSTQGGGSSVKYNAPALTDVPLANGARR